MSHNGGKDTGPLRIALIHYSCPPVIGGVEFILAAHARLFAEHGHDVDVVAGSGDHFHDLVKVRILPELASYEHPAIRRLITSGQADAEVEVVKRILRKELAGYDVLAVHNMLTMHFNPIAANALADLAEDGEVGGMIAWVHVSTFMGVDYLGFDFDAPVWTYLKRRIRNVTYVTISGDRRQRFSEQYGIPEEEITVVPDGVDLDDFLDLTDRADRIFDEMELEQCDGVALTPSRIVRRKNFEAGIELIDELKKLGLTVRWLITGALDEHNRAMRLYLDELRVDIARRGLEKEIHFLGARGDRVHFKTLRGLYHLCDFVLLPSKEEGFGIPILEAAICRRLVVVNDIPVFHEVAGDRAIYIGDRPAAEAAREIAAFLKSDPASQLKRHVLRNYLWRAVFSKDIEPLFHRVAQFPGKRCQEPFSGKGS